MKVINFTDRYLWVFNLILLALLGWAAARVTSTGVRVGYAQMPKIMDLKIPQVDAGLRGAYYPESIEKIEGRNLLRAKVREEEASTSEKGEPEKLTVQPLNVKLEGIITGPKYALATFNDNVKNKKLILKVGESIQPGAVIVSIKPRLVKVKREDGTIEEYSLEYFETNAEPKKVIPPPVQPASPDGQGEAPPPVDYTKIVKKISETEYLIDKAGFNSALQNMSQLLTEAKMVPNYGPDRKTDGFRVVRVKPQSIFFELGLRNRDVIESINGVPLDDPNKGFEFFLSLKDQSKFTIDLNRNTQKITYSYEVK